ncbi:hypothetical protein HWV62_31285 [Athelia sp. TMB]|nr:hypothetical protein HWV62_31285 [Athelia sp. TMB]
MRKIQCGVLLQGLAVSPNMFIGARIIIGFGLTFSANASPLLIAELAYPTQHSGLFPMDVESPDSDTSSGPYDPDLPYLESQASKVIARYHSSSNSEQDPLVVYEMAQIRHALKLEKEARKSHSLWQLWTTRGNLKRLRIIFAVAFFTQLSHNYIEIKRNSGNGLVSYYISLVLDGIGINSIKAKTAINGGLQIWNLAFALTGTFLVDKVGRRPLFLISTVGMLFAFWAWTLTTGLFSALKNTAAAKATVPIIFIYYALYDICYSPLLITYILEILPYGIRAQGFAATNMCIELALLFDQFVNPIVIERIGWKYYLVYCIWLVVEVAFVFMYIVETKGRTLEETAALFDGEKPRRDLAQMGGQAANDAAAGVIPLVDCAGEKKAGPDGSAEEWLENATLHMKAPTLYYGSQSDISESRRQSQESGLAIAP